MDTELAYKTSFCTEYERLLCNCVTALDCWKERRKEVVNRHLIGKQVGDEMS